MLRNRLDKHPIGDGFSESADAALLADVSACTKRPMVEQPGTWCSASAGTRSDLQRSRELSSKASSGTSVPSEANATDSHAAFVVLLGGSAAANATALDETPLGAGHCGAGTEATHKRSVPSSRAVAPGVPWPARLLSTACWTMSRRASTSGSPG